MVEPANPPSPCRPISACSRHVPDHPGLTSRRYCTPGTTTLGLCLGARLQPYRSSRPRRAPQPRPRPRRPPRRPPPRRPRPRGPRPRRPRRPPRRRHPPGRTGLLDRNRARSRCPPCSLAGSRSRMSGPWSNQGGLRPRPSWVSTCLCAPPFSARATDPSASRLCCETPQAASGRGRACATWAPDSTSGVPRSPRMPRACGPSR